VPERELPLFPLNVVLFPGMRLPLHIFEDRYKLMIGSCMVTDQTFGVSLIQSGDEVGGPADIFPIGTTARIVKVDRLPEGRMNLMTVGVERFRVLERLDLQPYAMGRVELLPESDRDVPDGLADRASRLFLRLLRARGLTEAQLEGLRLPEEPGPLSYLIASTLRRPRREQQRLLEEHSAELRLRRELAILENELGGPADVSARDFSLN
jgi:Lon protease-like protein